MEQKYDQDSSPGVSPVQIKEYMEEFVKFTLGSSIDETLGFDMGLSKDYCSNLLKDDPASPNPTTTFGVPTYPLYKRLASALYWSVSFGAFSRPYNKVELIHEDSCLKQKEDECLELVMEKGSELLSVLKTVDFELHVQEPFFTQLKDGLKTVEGRCAVGNYNRIASGSLILFNKCLVLQVQDVHRHASFSKMLGAESLTKVLPGVETIEEGVQIYRKFYSEEKERSNGVLAIVVTKPAAQPFISLASMLSGLSYGGLQRLLGFVHTGGTTGEALPPPRSTLLSSFLLPHNPDVKGSTLTDGARAVAKHVNRSSSKYWGAFGGSDSCKNRFAKDAISHLIAHCCWQNMHVVPPHGVVYEIRISDGYGARWSNGGTKFIGFLEPYMEDGHSKGWKH
ncbi:uncharacterized protein LOC130782968 isoform X2 [Actinidia eriantha]|uniref:uncharacterized protein LOC130782968 isoform X2 n=1 Tax=Actinidia eriantha TaxID=165200 RepID=UPI002584EB38|nr:uncharacterized protein LOC130782968 isoform X2 [Actinidia eriantha]